MEEERTVIGGVSSETYDASEKPFDFVEEGQLTALVCEADPTYRSKITDVLKEGGYLVTEAGSAQEALKDMRYHTYELVVVDETFDADNPDKNDVLTYLEELSMQIRRKIFVALLTHRFRTMDNMTAFNRSVNIIINLSNIDDFGTIVKRGVAENKAFYHVFEETLRGAGQT